jgi:hypothetical protein
MKNSFLAKILTLACFFIAVSAVNIAMAQDSVAVDINLINSYQLTPAQKASFDTLMRNISHQGGLVTVVGADMEEDGDLDMDDYGVMVIYPDNIHKEPNEPMPVVDKHDNRVKIKIEKDGDSKYKYFRDDDAHGTKIKYEDDGDLIIECDLVKRTAPVMPPLY